MAERAQVPGPAGDRSRLVVVGAIAVVVLGGGFLLLGGGGSSDGAAPATSSLPDAAADDQTAVLRSLDSYTIVGESTTTIGSNVTSVSQTVRADPDSGRVLATVIERDGDGTEPGLQTDYYTAGETTFVRQGLEGVNGSVYERQETASLVDGALATNVSVGDQFDFHEGATADGDVLYVVNSTDQIRGDGPADGDVENVSLRMVVDADSGLVTEFRYRLRFRMDGGDTLLFDLTRRVTAIGETTVESPSWLATAKRRTTPTA